MPKNNQSFADSRFPSSRNFNRMEDKYQQNEEYQTQCKKGFTSAIVLSNEAGEENIWYLKTVDPSELNINEGDVKKDYLKETRLVYFGDDQQVFIPECELRTDDATFGQICDGTLSVSDAIDSHSLKAKGGVGKATSLNDILHISLSSPQKD